MFISGQGNFICKLNQFYIQEKQIIMIVQPTDTIDLLQLIHSNNIDLFPDKSKGWIIILFSTHTITFYL